MKHFLQFAFFVAISAPLAFLPLSLARRVGEFLGLAAYHLWGNRRSIALANVRGAMERGAIPGGEGPSRIVRKNFMNMGRWVSEVVRCYYGRGDGLVSDVRVIGGQHFEEAKARGRGVLVITAHCGNWELSSLAFSARVDRLVVVARRQNNSYMDRFIVRAREGYGAEVIYKQGALRKLIAALKEGKTAAVLIDQAVVPAEGMLADFLGAPAWTIRAPVALANRTGAALVPAFMRDTGDGHEIICQPAVELSGDEAGDVRTLNSCVESFIRENPDQWLWIHRRWKRTEGVASPEGPKKA
jgi:KDO2-lipid IV(A) lauroyltransferase